MGTPPAVAISMVNLTGRFVDPQQKPLKGKLTFTPPTVLTMPDHDSFSACPTSVTLDQDGQFSIYLIATDNPGMSPFNFTYKVTEKIECGPVRGKPPVREYNIFLPSVPPTVDLADIAPVNPYSGQYLPVVGPPGAQGEPTVVNGKSGQSITLNAADVGADDFGSIGGIPVVGTPMTGQVIQATSDTAAKWETISTAPSGPASGDLSGTYPGPTVAKINGVTITNTPILGQVLVAGLGIPTATASWEGVPGRLPLGDVPAASDLAGTYPAPLVGKIQGLSMTPGLGDADKSLFVKSDGAGVEWRTNAPAGPVPAAGDLRGSYPAPFVARVQGTAVSSVPPAVGEALVVRVGGAGEPAKVAAWAPVQAAPTLDLQAFLAQRPFIVTHRGSGAEFPEHTMAAFEGATAAGAKAIEVSVNVTADGVPVCIHDTTLDRTTNAVGPVNAYTYAGMQNNVHTVSATHLGSGWDAPRTAVSPLVVPNSPIRLPSLDSVLNRFLGKVVIFLEPKSNPSIPIVQRLLAQRYPEANKSVVWKIHYQNPSLQTAKAAGFTTWAYLDATSTDAQMDAVDQYVDIWGPPVETTDARMLEIIARPGAKRVMAWDVLRRSEVNRLVGADGKSGLGVHGLMCASYLHVSRALFGTPAQLTGFLTKDDFATRTKAPGNLGARDYNTNWTLQFDDDPLKLGEAFIGPKLPWNLNRSLLMGSLLLPSTVTDATSAPYTIAWDMTMEDYPIDGEHAGIAFAKVDDSVYQFNVRNPTPGYHVVIRSRGAQPWNLQLYEHTSLTPNGTPRGQTNITFPGMATAGEFMSFQVRVTATQVILSHVVGGVVGATVTWTPTAADPLLKGRYFHLSNGSISSGTGRPRWRNVTAVATP